MRNAIALAIMVGGFGCGQDTSPPPPPPTPPTLPPTVPVVPTPSPPPVSPPGDTPAPIGGPSAGAQVGPPWVALTLPQIAGWERAPAEDHGPERGFIVEYNIHGRISVTVYVYRGGVASIRRDPNLLGAQVQVALTAMRQAQEMGRYEGVRELGPVSTVTIGSAPGAPVAAHQRVMLTREGTERLSESYVTTHRGFLFKLRISLFVDPSAATDASLRTLLDQLAASIHE